MGMPRMKGVFGLAVALMATVASARTFDVTAWRGETLAARVPDFCELGDEPDGISVRRGVLKDVAYAVSLVNRK